jgi:hypothetical protein
MLSLQSMSLSRRQFFRRLMRPGQKTPEERQARYDLMDTYVRTHLLPYDFALTAEQEAELLLSVRSALAETSDEELFSSIVRFTVEEVADRKIRHWREEDQLKHEQIRLTEIRHSAVDYVSAFLNGQATPAAAEQLKTRFAIEDLAELEVELTKRIREWITTVDDRDLREYDVVSVKDLVFAQLRSWC